MALPPSFSALPLRSRKAARTRVALMDGVLERLAHGPLPDISVGEVCSDVGVSQPTFFNYFGTKQGALVFYVYLWGVETQWHMHRALTVRQGLQDLFDRTAAVVRATPWLMTEIIVFQLRSTGPPPTTGKGSVPYPSLADKLLRFPQLEGIEELAPLPIQVIFEAAVTRALESGELPATTDVDLGVRLLLSLFFGAAASQRDADVVADTLSRGLDLTWRGLSEVNS